MRKRSSASIWVSSSPGFCDQATCSRKLTRCIATLVGSKLKTSAFERSEQAAINNPSTASPSTALLMAVTPSGEQRQGCVV